MDTDKLKGKILWNHMTMESFAASLGMDRATLWRKTGGTSDFTREELLNARQILHLTAEEMEEIFFSN